MAPASVSALEWDNRCSKDTPDPQSMKDMNNIFHHEELSELFCCKPLKFGGILVNAAALAKIWGIDFGNRIHACF